MGSAVKSAMSSGRAEKGTSELCPGPETKELPTYTNLCGASVPGFMQPETRKFSFHQFPHC